MQTGLAHLQVVAPLQQHQPLQARKGMVLLHQQARVQLLVQRPPARRQRLRPPRLSPSVRAQAQQH